MDKKTRKLFVSFVKSLYLCTRKTKTSLLEDPLAQLVEHNTFNVGVLGSSPKRITERVLVRVSFLCFYILFVKYWLFSRLSFGDVLHA